MIVEFGHFALVLALMVAAVQSVVPIVGVWRGDERFQAVANPAAVTSFLLVGLSFAALTSYLELGQRRWIHVVVPPSASSSESPI